MYSSNTNGRGLQGSFRAKFALALAVPMILLIVSNVIALDALVKVGDAQQRLSRAQNIRVVAEDIKYQRYLTRFDIRQFVLKGKASDRAAEAKDAANLDADIAKITALAAGDSELTALLNRLQSLSSIINQRNAFQVGAIAKDPVDMLQAFRGKAAAGLSGDVVKSLADNNISIPQEIAALASLDVLTIGRVQAAQNAVDSIYRMGSL